MGRSPPFFVGTVATMMSRGNSCLSRVSNILARKFLSCLSFLSAPRTSARGSSDAHGEMAKLAGTGCRVVGFGPK